MSEEVKQEVKEEHINIKVRDMVRGSTTRDETRDYFLFRVLKTTIFVDDDDDGARERERARRNSD